MKNELLVGVITALLAGAALFTYNAQLNNNELAQFEEFKTTYGRAYSLEENVYRFGVFITNLKKINEHNADKTQTYTMGVNQFTDMTTVEFIEKMLMKDLPSPLEAIVEEPSKSPLGAAESIDWRTKNVLNPVKNQGQCGSCWAFSTTGTLESNVAIGAGSIPNFSEQQLVDCCGKKGYQCQGCSGAWPEWAFNYINAAGIVEQKVYPYTAVEGTCKDTSTAKKYLNSAKPSTMLPQNNDASLKDAVSAAPVSVCVDASNWSAYRSGVFSNCGKTNLNHAVTAVGYQADGTWIVRNSWGASWGDQGHIRLAAGNTCGIAAHAIVPNLA